jgi:hypothetical protein
MGMNSACRMFQTFEIKVELTIEIFCIKSSCLFMWKVMEILNQTFSCNRFLQTVDQINI